MFSAAAVQCVSMKFKHYAVYSAAAAATAAENIYSLFPFKNPLKVNVTDFWLPNDFKIPVMILVIAFDD